MFRVGCSSVRPFASARAFTAPSGALRSPVSRQLAFQRSFGSFKRPQNVNQKATELKDRFSTAFSSAFRRSYYREPPLVQTAQRFDWKRFGMTAGAVAGATVLIDALINGQTGNALSAIERDYLKETFIYTGGGLTLTAMAARALFTSGAAFRIMSANPWLVMGVSLVGSIGTMMGVYYTDPSNSAVKHLCWLGFNGFQAATLSPLYFMNPAILSRAALYTVGLVGGLSYVGATAKNDTFLYLGGPLLGGLCIVALSSMAPMILPLGVRGLAVTEAVSLYGGLAVFGGMVLYDTQKIRQHAKMAAAGVMKRDPLRESIALELDMINIFIRLVQILANNQNNRR
ncbi:inhibitor of apoptosis-promoting Bax1-domain-containing protein [Schizophyllum fasciatum]